METYLTENILFIFMGQLKKITLRYYLSKAADERLPLLLDNLKVRKDDFSVVVTSQIDKFT